MARGRKPKEQPRKKRRFGSIDVLSSGTARARFRDRNTGEMVTEYFETEELADHWLAKQQTNLNEGSYVNPNKGKVRFKEVAESWEKNLSTDKENTGKEYIATLHSRILPKWGGYQFRAITPTKVREWIKEMEREGLAYGTRNNRRTVLSLILQHGVEEGYGAKNSCKDIGAGRKATTKYRPTFLTRSELYAFADQITDQTIEKFGFDLGYDLAVLLAGFSGLRSGELWALRVEDIDFVRHVVWVRNSIRKGIETLPKAYEIGTSPIPPKLLDRLAEHIDERELKATDRLFQTISGTTVHHSNWSRDIYRPARLAASGLNGKKPNVHDLRHTCATLYFDRGFSGEQVARILRDKPETVREHYQHYYPKAFDGTVLGLDDIEIGPDLSLVCQSPTHLEVVPALENAV